MVAELSNPAFREKLKARNLWQRIIDSIANLFGFRKDSSNYAKISKNLSRIIDNYDTNFTKNYENIESKNIDFAKKNTIESNLDSTQKAENLNKKQWKQVDSAKIAHTATQEEFNDFIAKAWSNDKEQYKLMPNAIKVAEIDKKLQKALGLTKGDTYLTKSQAIHTRESRKSSYNQNVPLNEYKNMPQVISDAKVAYVDTESRFLIPFTSAEKDKINAIVLESDTAGNLIITTKKINLDDLNQYEKVEAAAAGVAPAIPSRP